MPAERDQSQKFKFVYSNLYQIYRKGVEAAKAAPEVVKAGAPHPSEPADRTVVHAVRPVRLREMNKMEPTRSGIVTGTIIKQAHRVQPLVRPHRPAELRPNHRINFSEIHAQAAKVSARNSMSDLKQNLSELDELQSKLRFMLKELEDLTKGSKS